MVFIVSSTGWLYLCEIEATEMETNPSQFRFLVSGSGMPAGMFGLVIIITPPWDTLN